MSLKSEILVARASQQKMQAEGVSSETYRAIYAGGAPWEIGRAQPEIVRLFEAGEITGRVLDVGCGLGENAMFLAAHGLDIIAIDFVADVVVSATRKSRERGLNAQFLQRNALSIADLGITFNTVIDSATFHTFSDTERRPYVEALWSVLEEGGCVHLIGLSSQETRPGGARRLSLAEIEAAFAPPWSIECIRDTRYVAAIFPNGGRAWSAKLRKRDARVPEETRRD